MPKPLCELTKLLRDDLNGYMKLVRKATHVCRKCGRSANDKLLLCKPARITKGATS